MDKMSRLRELVRLLNAASRAYYQENREIISNMEYDRLYDELEKLEEETGVQLAGSPSLRVGYEVVGSLAKSAHDIPMLSLDKTKDTDALISFLGEQEGLLSWKLDGLTIVLKYNGGKLVQALTRGNGVIGEDVTHNARVFANIPLSVPFDGKFDIRGEAVISIADFNAINEDDKYKNPRNLCSGAVRQLSSETAAKRRVLFYAFGLLSKEGEAAGEKKSAELEWLSSLGFDLVEYKHVNSQNVAEAVQIFKERIPCEAVQSDGLVLTFDDISYSESLGTTSKFPRDSIAFKWADDLSETTLIKIEWNTSRTGLVNPVAVFEPVDIEGSEVSRAGMHNVSILKSLELIPGDRITVYKANMIIPQVAENLSRTGTRDVTIPEECGVCGGKTEISGDPEVLYCQNPECAAKHVRALSHFVSRDAMNISGLSEQTLEKLISRGFLSNYTDLFKLDRFESEIVEMEGFGEKSYQNLISSIETAKDVFLPNFIHALGIRHVGLANAKLLSENFEHDGMKILECCQGEDFFETVSEIKGFGEAIAVSLHEYFSQEENRALYLSAMDILRIKKPIMADKGNLPLAGLGFVITGDINEFKNRKEFQAFIEKNGGRVTGSVTAKTSFLINNNAASASSKNKKAAELGVPVITEKEFLARF